MTTIKFDPLDIDCNNGGSQFYNNSTSSTCLDNGGQHPLIHGSYPHSPEDLGLDRLPYIGDGIGVEPERNAYVFFVTLWTIVVPVVFSLIAFVGIVGNVIVLVVIATSPKLRTSTNKFLANLAIADIIFLSSCVPFQAHKYASWSWPFGEIWCKVIQYILFVTVYVTVWTLVCVAGVRYIYLVRTNSRLRFLLHGMCIEICMCLWIVMFFAHIPTFISHKVNTVDHHYSYCGINPDSAKEVLLSFFVCAYALPLFLICLLYLMIVRHLNRQETKYQTHRRSSFNNNRRHHSVRVSKIIAVVVLCFTLSWFPFHIHNLVSLYHRVPQGNYYEVLRIVWHCMAYGNSLANPFIYNFISLDFRMAIRTVLRGKCSKEQQKPGGGGEDEEEMKCRQQHQQQNGGEQELAVLNGDVLSMSTTGGGNVATHYCHSETHCHSEHKGQEDEEEVEAASSLQ